MDRISTLTNRIGDGLEYGRVRPPVAMVPAAISTGPAHAGCSTRRGMTTKRRPRHLGTTPT